MACILIFGENGLAGAYKYFFEMATNLMPASDTAAAWVTYNH